MYRLRRYYPDRAEGASLLLVPPMMLSAEINDVSPASSGVSILHDHGVDPWLVDGVASLIRTEHGYVADG